MRVPLDECLPKKLKHALEGHEAATVPEMGWAGKTNGELLQLAKEVFDVFVTMDQNLSFQQNLRGANIAVVVLKASNNRLETLKPLMSRLLKALETIRPDEILTVT